MLILFSLSIFFPTLLSATKKYNIINNGRKKYKKGSKGEKVLQKEKKGKEKYNYKSQTTLQPLLIKNKQIPLKAMEKDTQKGAKKHNFSHKLSKSSYLF